MPITNANDELSELIESSQLIIELVLIVMGVKSIPKPRFASKKETNLHNVVMKGV